MSSYGTGAYGTGTYGGGTPALLTAEPLNDIAAVRLTIDGGEELLTLTRTDDNGTRPVRLYRFHGLSGGLLITYDAEAALTGPVTYAVEVAGSDGTHQSATVTVSLDGAAPRIAPVVRPHLGTAGLFVIDYDSTRPSTTVVHERILGRSTPLASLGRLGTRRGTFGMFARTYAEARDIERALSAAEVAMLRQTNYPGMDMYFTPGAVRTTPLPDDTPERRWEVRVEYVETDYPASHLHSGYLWTFAASTARNATFAASAAEFPTFRNLTVGP